jgi:hypothetical protein
MGWWEVSFIFCDGKERSKASLNEDIDEPDSFLFFYFSIFIFDSAIALIPYHTLFYNIRVFI